MSVTTESKKMITLRSSDGEEFEIEENVAKKSQTIKHMIEDDCAESVIPLPNVNSKILSKVIEYLKKHVDSSSYKSDEKTAGEDLKAWDTEFVKEVLLDKLNSNLLKLGNKVKFILDIVNGKIIVLNRCKDDLLLELHQKKFKPFPKKAKGTDVVIAEASVDAGENEENSSKTVTGLVNASDYEYLLSVTVEHFTRDKLQELVANEQKLKNLFEELKNTSPMTLWMRDFDALEKQLDELERKDDEATKMRKMQEEKRRKLYAEATKMLVL